ncbi:MAG: pteridine reductase [Gammaproteobacteria bacterium]
MPEPIALVTGGARRIGAAIVRALHARGLSIVIHCNQSMADAENLATELNATRAGSVKIVQADLCDQTAVDELANKVLRSFGRMDVLVNNASLYFPTPLDLASQKDWDALVDSNVKAHFFLSRSLAGELRQRAGAIVNITDIYADRPLAGHAIYNIAKAGLKALTRSLALDLAPEVRVNAVAPGAILWGPDLADESKPDVVAKRQKFLQSIPLGRLGTPREIAATACYLALDNPYMTGATIRVDGGRALT